MFVIKYEDIKRRAEKAFNSHFSFAVNSVCYCPEGMQPSIRDAVQRLHRISLQRIEDWDVRCLRSLIDQFPSCVPMSWRKATLYAYIDDASGQWVVSEITSFAEKGLI